MAKEQFKKCYLRHWHMPYKSLASYIVESIAILDVSRRLIVGSDPRSLAVGESKWDAKASGTGKA
jgi:hypothetical protein